MEINLEKVDKVIERTNVSYGVAKHALEVCDGDVLDAIIYIEEMKKSQETYETPEKEENFEEFKNYLKSLIKKGNISRIKIRKDDRVYIDIPVSAGLAAGVIAVMLPQLLALGVITAIATKVTIEITKENGDVEIINKYVKNTYEDIKEKASDVADVIKSKVSEVKNGGVKSKSHENHVEDSFYTYTVNFDDEEEEK